MLQALLHGKLSREQENMEDVLTSEVFGPLRYVPAEVGLRPFLSRAMSLTGTPLLENAKGKLALRDMRFWPTWEEPGCLRCEPDVFVVLADEADALYAIAIEAKYWSGKSNRDAGVVGTLHDQLTIQWQNLWSISSRMGAKPALVYTTTHMSMPHEELYESQRDWSMIRPSASPFPLYWLSWRELESLFRNNEHLPLRDISMCADRLNLTWFRGFTRFPDCVPIKWNFGNRRKPNAFRWGVAEPTPALNWNFRK